MTEYTTDHRALDRVPLGRINGAAYYELHTIVRELGGVQETIGRASDWPIISRDARLAELTALLSSTIQHVSEAEQQVQLLSADLAISEEFRADSECHVAELITRISVYEEHIARLETALAETPAQIPPPEAESAEMAFLASIALLEAPDDGRVPCDYPGCTDRVKPNGLAIHKRKIHGVKGTVGHNGANRPAPDSPNDRRKCPYCSNRPKLSGMQAHIERRHPAQTTVVAVPTPLATVAPPAALSLGEAPWRCASCELSTHARSLKDPALCIKCVVAQADSALSNGHAVAA